MLETLAQLLPDIWLVAASAGAIGFVAAQTTRSPAAQFRVWRITRRLLATTVLLVLTSAVVLFTVRQNVAAQVALSSSGTVIDCSTVTYNPDGSIAFRGSQLIRGTRLTELHHLKEGFGLIDGLDPFIVISDRCPKSG